MIKFIKLNFKNNFTISHILQLYSPSTLNNYARLLNYSSCNKSFCNLYKLDIEKLSLDKLDDNPININKLQDTTNFNKEDHIIEFGPEIKWEETVLNSDIPVVVDCYAK
jgi:hypothetical protein